MMSSWLVVFKIFRNLRVFRQLHFDWHYIGIVQLIIFEMTYVSVGLYFYRVENMKDFRIFNSYLKKLSAIHFDP